MELLNLYQHINCQDMAICPVKILYKNRSKEYEVTVRYFNVSNPKRPFDMGVGPEIVKIKKGDLNKWKLFSTGVNRDE